MTCAFLNQPGQPCCTDPCRLMPTNPDAPDAGFNSLEAIEAEWALRAGSWSDVAGSSGVMSLTASGVQLLALNRPNYTPYGVKLTTYFRGRDGSAVRFYVGADNDVSLSAEVTLGADCGQLRFYEESISSEQRIGDIHWIRELRAEEWHKLVLCYDPARGYLTATITTLAGETWAYSVQISGTGQTGYGVGTASSTAEFKTFSASALDAYIGRDPSPCGGVSISTRTPWSAGVNNTVQGFEGRPLIEIADMLDNWLSFLSEWYAYATIHYADGSSASFTSPDLVGFGPDEKYQTWLRSITGLEAATVTTLITGDFQIDFGILDPAVTSIDLTWHTTSPNEYGGSATVTQSMISPRNEVNVVTISGRQTGDSGSWTLTFGGETTSTLDIDASAAAVQTAIETLSSVGAGNVSVSGADGGPWTITFIGALAAADQGAVTVAALPNEIQVVTVSGNPDGGDWTLTFDGQTTDSLAPDATGAQVQAALEALSNLGSGNVSVSGDGPYAVTFQGTLAGTDVPELTATYTLTGCDCVYDVYSGYDSDCVVPCTTCDPSCALAGSEFSATLSACDWDQTGYTFSDGEAVGTGKLEHRTRIYTFPYIARFRVTAAHYPHTYTCNVDTQKVDLVFLRRDAPAPYDADYFYWVDLYVNGVKKQHLDLGRRGKELDPPMESVTIQACRLNDRVIIVPSAGSLAEFQPYITGGVLSIPTSAPTVPAFISVDGDDPESHWLEIGATRSRLDLPDDVICGTCSFIQHCEPCRESAVPSAMILDFVGILGMSVEAPSTPTTDSTWIYLPTDCHGVTPIWNDQLQCPDITVPPTTQYCCGVASATCGVCPGEVVSFEIPYDTGPVLFPVRISLTGMGVDGVRWWPMVAYWTFVKGEYIYTHPSHSDFSGFYFYSEWEPDHSRWYLLVCLSQKFSSHAEAPLDMAGVSSITNYYYAKDLCAIGEDVNCLTFHDLECDFVGCNRLWQKDNELGTNIIQRTSGQLGIAGASTSFIVWVIACGSQGNPYPGLANRYFVSSPSKVYVTSV